MSVLLQRLSILHCTALSVASSPINGRREFDREGASTGGHMFVDRKQQGRADLLIRD